MPTVLLLHCDGADGSTTFVDSSPAPKTVTANNGAQVDTAQSKFGGASALFDGVNDYLSIASTSDFGFGTGAWTVEAWVYITSEPDLGQTYTVCDFREESDWPPDSAQLLITRNRRLQYWDNDSTYGPGSGDQVPLSTWTHIAWAYNGTTLYAFVAGVLVYSGSVACDFQSARPLRIGAAEYGGEFFRGHLDELRITKGECLYTATFTPPTSPFTNAPTAEISAAGPLGAPAVRAASGLGGSVTAASPLRAARVHAWPRYVALRGPSILQAPATLALHDFSSVLGDTVTRYALDLIGEFGTVRVPISSWQATLQTQAKCYLQAVVPACAPYVDQITAATAISIKRIAVRPDGTEYEYEMANAPTPTATLSQGPRNYTATISGYADAFIGSEDPPSALDRRLRDTRTTTVTPSSMRVRCAIDWLLRPGQRALIGGDQSIIVAFINYYANVSDEYMDVGNRAP